MPVFRDTEHVYACIGGLFDWAGRQKDVAEKLHATGLVIRMAYTEPEASITVDCREPEVRWYRSGEGPAEAEIEFRMKADVAHRFWLGKVNLLIALTKRDIVAKGPTMKVMKILPILKPLYAQYPKILNERGETALMKV